jgi:hypothetical protein
LQNYSTIIGKILTPVKRRKFKQIVQKYNGDFAVKKLSCWEQFVSILLGQITNCSSLREIEGIIKYHSDQQYHLGIRKDAARSTLAKANETRDWHIYHDLFVDLKEICVNMPLRSQSIAVLLGFSILKNYHGQ